MKGDKLGRQGGSGRQEQPRREIMKGDKLGTRRQRCRDQTVISEISNPVIEK